MAHRIRDHVAQQVELLSAMSTEDMLETRYQRLMSYGN